MRRRCRSPRTMTWSRHSRRIEPIRRSAKAFAWIRHGSPDGPREGRIPRGPRRDRRCRDGAGDDRPGNLLQPCQGAECGGEGRGRFGAGTSPNDSELPAHGVVVPEQASEPMADWWPVHGVSQRGLRRRRGRLRLRHGYNLRQPLRVRALPRGRTRAARSPPDPHADRARIAGAAWPAADPASGGRTAVPSLPRGPLRPRVSLHYPIS